MLGECILFDNGDFSQDDSDRCSSLSAGLFRQATYTTARLGIYQSLLEHFRKADGRPPNFFFNLLLGVISGGLGSFIGTPAEVALVRMTLDGRLPVAERRNYAHVFDALIRITREEGVTKLWRGAIPTATRAMIVNAAQMPTYSQAKHILISNGIMQQGFPLHAVSSLFAGLVTTAVSLPVDIVKTRYQNMKVINGKPEYSGIIVSDHLRSAGNVRSTSRASAWRWIHGVCRYQAH